MSERNPAPKPYPMTVVMATLGGPTLKATIEQMNRGTVVPAEILVCIPQKEATRVADLWLPNVRVLITDCRGQVAQRAVGFRNAVHDVVMQLDDDILVDENCIASLLQTLLRSGPNVAVAPVLQEIMPEKRPRMNNLMRRIYYWLMNGSDGYKMGVVSRAGAEFGYDASTIVQGERDVEWVPGGCLIHFRDNLIKENYFPFKGKAYCEDLLHSYYLKKNGVKLRLDVNAHCLTENSPAATYGFKEFISIIAGDYRVRRHFVKLSSRSYLRMHLYYVALVFNYFVKKMITKTRGSTG